MSVMDTLVFDDVAQWDAWLAEHYAQGIGVWLRIARRESGGVGVTIREAGDVALCYGWIDSQRKRLDEHYFLQRYSPRRTGAAWSRVNVERIEALLAGGRMREPGLAEVRAAQADGRWAAAYPPQREASVPREVAALLQANERARRSFEALGKTQRYLLLLPVLKARTATARTAQLQAVLRKLDAAPE
ncbi:MAG: YdeI/OmpD-associated family protein [Chloroflexota bacterium]|nr:YdeI/OmpD-associated family protein [Chloroflexota bacterium]